MNLWIKRALGAAVLGGGLLAATAGAAGAQEVSADVSASLGRPTSADVRVCADGRLLSRLVGGCNRSGTTASAQAGRASGVRVRARVPRLASADVSIGARRSRPRATVSADASVTPRSRAATAGADAAASLSRPRAGELLDLDATASLAGVGLLGTSPFTLVGEPAGEPLLAIGDLTLADVADQAPAGIGVLDTGPIASGNRAAVDVGDVSPSVPVMVCGNGVGVLGDASASCGTSQPAASPSGSGSGSSGTSDGGSVSATTGSMLDGTAAGNQVDAGIGSVPPSVPATVCGNGVGLLGDASLACTADTSTGGTTAPPPGTTTPDGSTDTDGIPGTPGSTDTSGIPGPPG